MHGKYDSVANLDDAAQRQLLTHGDGAERLWAAWAICTRVGASAIPVVNRVMFEGASEGLRQQLLVVVAGLGERQLLATFATYDPSPRVQATAMTYYLRTAGDAKSEAAAFALPFLSSDKADVILAILGEHEAGRVDVPVSLVTSLLASPNIDVRVAATRVLCSPSPSSDVVSRLGVESDADLVALIVARLSRHDAGNALATVAGTPNVIRVLGLLRAKFERLNWSEMACLAADCDPDGGQPNFELMDAMLSTLSSPLETAALAWVGRYYVSSLERNDRKASSVEWRSRNALLTSITETNVEQLPTEAVHALHAVSRAWLEAEKRALLSRTLGDEPDDYDEYDDESDIASRVVQLEQLTTVLKQALDDRART